MLDGVEAARDLAHGPVQEEHGRREREELARRERVRQHAMPAVPERAHDAEGDEHLHQGPGQLIEARVLERQIEDAAVDAIEPRLIVRFLSERLDGLGARERLLQRDVQLGGPSLGAQVDLVELPAQRADGDPDEWEDGGRDQRELPVPHEHHDQQADGGRKVSHDVHQDRRG